MSMRFKKVIAVALVSTLSISRVQSTILAEDITGVITDDTASLTEEEFEKVEEETQVESASVVQTEESEVIEAVTDKTTENQTEMSTGVEQHEIQMVDTETFKAEEMQEIVEPQTDIAQTEGADSYEMDLDNVSIVANQNEEIVLDSIYEEDATDAIAFTEKYAFQITTQPMDVICEENSTATFSVEASGIGLAYQWQYSKDNGSTWLTSTVKTASYSTSASAMRNGWIYRCIVTDSNGNKEISETARLTVLAKVTITSQPSDVECEENSTATFSVEASGTGLAYQWQYSKDNGNRWLTSTVKTANYSTSALAIRNGWVYRCIVTDSNGNKEISETARLAVLTKVTITSQPSDVECEENSTATFSVEASGTGLTYQWQYSKDNGNRWLTSTVKTASYSTSALTIRNGWVYRCIVADINGNCVTSDAAKLTVTVLNPISITSHPQAWEGAENDTAMFSVTAEGKNLTYQWQYSINNGTTWLDSSVKKNTYSTTASASRNGWYYRCVITDTDGNKVTSLAAKLSVITDFVIIKSPESIDSYLGEMALFKVQASGKDVTYQWQNSMDNKTWADITTALSAKTSKLSIKITPGNVGNYYRCKITNGDGQSLLTESVRSTLKSLGFIIYEDNTYLAENGCLVKGLYKYMDSLYYFNESGVMATGFQIVDGVRYYFDLQNGSAVTGFVTLDNGYTYYFAGENGTLTGLQTINGNTYYLNSLGMVQSGLYQIDGNWYYFDDNGVAAVGITYLQSNHNTYYFDKTGKACTGWQEISGAKYYFYDSGIMARGLTKINGMHYYFDFENGQQQFGFVKVGQNAYMYFSEESGNAQTGLMEYGEALYYFSPDAESYGVSLTGLQTINGDKYYFNESSGQAEQGFVTVDGHTYYMGDDYKMVTGLQHIGDSWYYFSNVGIMATGLTYVNEKVYYFDQETGYAHNGWYTCSDGTVYYFDEATGAAVTGIQVINNETYSFTSMGKLQTGIVYDGTDVYYFSDDNLSDCFIDVGGKTYYINSNHQALTGLQLIEKKLYYFNDSGVMQTGFQIVDGVRYYFDLTNGDAYTGFITLESNGDTYYFDGQNGTLAGLQMIGNDLYYFNDYGIVQYGRISVDGEYYYFQPGTGAANGGWHTVAMNDGAYYKSYYDIETLKAVKGLQKIDGCLYYFSDNGIMLKGRYTVNEVSYYFDETGKAYTGWYRTPSGYDCYYDGENGMFTGPGIYEIGEGCWYYFSENGVRMTGKRTVNGISMYFDPVSAMLTTGFVTTNGYTYYYDGLNGMLTGLRKVDGNQYYFSASGIMQYGYQNINNVKYYFDDNTGIAVSGLQYYADGDKYYYMDTNSAAGVKTGAQTYGNVLYLLSNNGIPMTGFFSATSNPLGFRAYFDPDTGEQQLGLITYTTSTGTPVTYYFVKDDCLINTSAVVQKLEEAKSSGDGWYTIEGLTYYVENGAFLTGVNTINGKVYYFSELSGAMLTGLRRIGKDFYYFDETYGYMLTGVTWIGEDCFYFDQNTGAKCCGVINTDGGDLCFLEGDGYVTGNAQVNGVNYYFEENGVGKIVSTETEMPVQAAKANTWSTIEGKTYYYNAYGELTHGIQLIDKKLYNFSNEDGSLQTGFAEDADGEKYYFTEDGALTGLQTIGGNTYYFSPVTGSMCKGFYSISGKMYYFGADGVMYTGWIDTENGTRCYLSKDGILTGLQTIDGKTYWFGTTGVLYTGIKNITDSEGNEKICYFGEDGAMRTGFIVYNDGLYYFDINTGAQMTGLQKIDDKEYYFNEYTGKAVTGIKSIDDVTYYFDPETAERKFGVIEYKSNVFCLVAEGDGVAHGIVNVDGDIYYFNETTGAARTGYYNIDGVRYYFDPQTGASVSGIYTISDGRTFGFIAGGGCMTGLQKINGKEYYFYPGDYQLAVGLVSIDKNLYYFDKDKGKLYNQTVEVAGVTYSIDEEGVVSVIGDNNLAKLIKSGISKLGTPYGSNDLDSDQNEEGSYTCSDFVASAFNDAGIPMITTVYYQYYSLLNNGYDITNISDLSDAQPGDIIYFSMVNCKYGDACTFWNELHHVGIYLGDGKLMQATEGTYDGRSGVVIQDLKVSSDTYIYDIIRLNGLE